MRDGRVNSSSWSTRVARRVALAIVLCGTIAGLRAAEPAAPALRWPEIDPALRKEEAFGLKFSILLDQRPGAAWKFLESELKRHPEPYVKGYIAWAYIWGPSFGMEDRKDLPRGVALAREAAEAGSAIGQETLGIALGQGLGVAPDQAESVRLLQQAAQRGSMRALGILGRYAVSGYGVPRDEEEAARKLRRAAELSGEMLGYLLLADAYENGGRGVPRDLAKAVECYYRIAIYGTRYVEKDFDRLEKLGAPEVPLYRALALIHDANEGVWVTKGKVQLAVPVLEQLGGKLAAAQYELGTIYTVNHWVSHDYKKALGFLNRARGFGDDRANYTLAYMRLVGRGMPRDEAGALSDLELLSSDGDPNAATLLGAMHYWGSSDAPSLQKDAHKTYEFSRLGAENGSLTGLRNLARCYEEGIGVPRDYLLAAKLYWIAAKRGSRHSDEIAIRISHFVELP